MYSYYSYYYIRYYIDHLSISIEFSIFFIACSSSNETKVTATNMKLINPKIGLALLLAQDGTFECRSQSTIDIIMLTLY